MGALVAAAALMPILGISASAGVVHASYSNGAEVPLQADEVTVAGQSVDLELHFAPAKDANLVLVRNTGSKFIQGKFSNLAQGQIVTLEHNGVPYRFVANYYGGHGRDLVLSRIDVDDIAAAALPKLDDRLLLALKKSRSQAPFNQATTLRPESYEKDGRVLVDIQTNAAGNLTDAIAQAGGDVVKGWQTAVGLRAWIPIGQLEAVARLSAVQSMVAARPSTIHRVAPQS